MRLFKPLFIFVFVFCSAIFCDDTYNIIHIYGANSGKKPPENYVLGERQVYIEEKVTNTTSDLVAGLNMNNGFLIISGYINIKDPEYVQINSMSNDRRVVCSSTEYETAIQLEDGRKKAKWEEYVPISKLGKNIIKIKVAKAYSEFNPDFVEDSPDLTVTAYVCGFKDNNRSEIIIPGTAFKYAIYSKNGEKIFESDIFSINPYQQFKNYVSEYVSISGTAGDLIDILNPNNSKNNDFDVCEDMGNNIYKKIEDNKIPSSGSCYLRLKNLYQAQQYLILFGCAYCDNFNDYEIDYAEGWEPEDKDYKFLYKSKTKVIDKYGEGQILCYAPIVNDNIIGRFTFRLKINGKIIDKIKKQIGLSKGRAYNTDIIYPDPFGKFRITIPSSYLKMLTILNPYVSEYNPDNLYNYYLSPKYRVLHGTGPFDYMQGNVSSDITYSYTKDNLIYNNFYSDYDLNTYTSKTDSNFIKALEIVENNMTIYNNNNLINPVFSRMPTHLSEGDMLSFTTNKVYGDYVVLPFNSSPKLMEEIKCDPFILDARIEKLKFKFIPISSSSKMLFTTIEIIDPFKNQKLASCYNGKSKDSQISLKYCGNINPDGIQCLNGNNNINNYFYNFDDSAPRQPKINNDFFWDGTIKKRSILKDGLYIARITLSDIIGNSSTADAFFIESNNGPQIIRIGRHEYKNGVTLTAQDGNTIPISIKTFLPRAYFDYKVAFSYESISITTTDSLNIPNELKLSDMLISSKEIYLNCLFTDEINTADWNINSLVNGKYTIHIYVTNKTNEIMQHFEFNNILLNRQ